MTDRRRDDEHVDEHEHARQISEEEAEELEEEAAELNPDPQTRREALELELMEEHRSEVGEDVGDEID